MRESLGCRLRRGAAAALCLGLLAGAARAGDIAGSGWLDAIDAEARTLTIREQSFRLTAATELLGAKGERLELRDLEELNQPWVSYAGRSGAPLPVLERLRVLDPDADG